LLSKTEHDVHDRGIRHIAQKLMDAGMEVIFIRYRVPEDVVKTALDEDVDVIGISFLGGGHNFDVPEIIRLLKEKKMADLPLIIGGMIPPADVPPLLEAGVKKYYGPGSSVSELVQYVKGLGAHHP
jgi:methylmalonyl-CoA mutase C-terminal domain/subunit